MGLWGSAFCATLAHYYKEIRPVIKGLAGFQDLDELVEGRNHDLTRLHPVHPGQIPNFALGLKDSLPPTCPESIFKDDYLDLMDAGMSNNLPIYPLLREGRNVDIIVCFDASADIKQENWLSVVDNYAKQRGIRGWPMDAGWPKVEDVSREVLQAADTATAQQAATRVAKAREEGGASHDIEEPPDTTTIDQNKDENELGYCNVWVGTKEERPRGSTSSPKTPVKPDMESMLKDPNAGITMVYFPLLPNPKVEGVDPDKSAFLSTWNFIYSPEEIDKVVDLAKANFEVGKEQTRRTVRAVYERKKANRLIAEKEERSKRWNRHIRRHGDQFQ